jgi:uncharacterized membrane protein (Fun14 family)
MGGIIGFAGTGYGIQNLGMVTTLVIGVCLTLVATVLLIPIRQVGPGKGAASHLKTHAA